MGKYNYTYNEWAKHYTTTLLNTRKKFNILYFISAIILLAYCNNILYLLVSVLLLQTWRLVSCKSSNQCPEGRHGHIATCLGYGGQHKYLLISGGFDSSYKTLHDLWLLDLQSGLWEQVRTTCYDLVARVTRRV